MDININITKDSKLFASQIQDYIEEQIRQECEWSDVGLNYENDNFELFVALTTKMVCENIVKDL